MNDIHLLALLSKMLQMANYDVRIATSAPMALGMLADGGREPDLAILDIQMPGMSGLELAAHVRANSPVPFLFVSASATEQGAVGCLVKPIEQVRAVPTRRRRAMSTVFMPIAQSS
jgi:CheY-like chemotaxis protein